MPSDISKLSGRRIMVVGDLMLDEYIWGTVDRISPEAPVQVVSVVKENFTLGGAGNVINNLVSLGADVVPLGVAGEDDSGRIMKSCFTSLGLPEEGVFYEAQRPTSRKARLIAANQHVFQGHHPRSVGRVRRRGEDAEGARQETQHRPEELQVGDMGTSPVWGLSPYFAYQLR